MSRPFTFDRVVRMVIALAVTAVAVWLTGVLHNVLLPFALACLIAYIMEPFVEFNQRIMRTRRRGIAVFVTLFDCTVLAGILIYFISPVITSEIASLERMVDEFSRKDIDIPLIPGEWMAYLRTRFDFSQLVDQLNENGRLLDSGESIISVSVEVIMHSIEWLLTFIYVVFILLDYEDMGTGFRLLVPDKYKAIVFRIADDIKVSMNKYFRSQLLIAACAAVFYCIGFSIVGIPMAIILGLLVGVLYMIPYFQYVTFIPVVAICLIDSLDGHVSFWSQLGGCCLVYVVSQCICDYILTPKVMGKSLGLNPAIILLSLSIWGTLLGIIGMIIALPMTTLVLAYYKKVFIEHKPLDSPTPIG